MVLELIMDLFPYIFRVLTTVELGLTSLLAVTSQMLITRLAYMLALTLVVPMGRLCQARFTSYL